MYVSARAVGDGDYRTMFLDPLIDDLHTTLNVDADRPTAPSVDVADVSD